MKEDEDFTFRYMTRFQCIGPACEEHCCGGWRVDVDDTHLSMLRMAAGQAGSDRARIRSAFQKIPDKAAKKRKGKGPTKAPHALKLDACGNCVLLEADRRCHVHATLGENLLPDVCATYPRRIVKIGDRTQLTAGLSCPEVSRQLLLHDDAVDQVPLERGMVPRRSMVQKLDTRDVRPFVRLTPEFSDFALRRLSDAGRPFAHRLFALTLFAHRTQTVLAKSRQSGDLELVREEIRRLDDPAVLDEIGRRFDAIDTPTLPVLLVARELVRGDLTGTRSPSFRELVTGVFDTYTKLDLVEARRETGNADAAMSLAVQAAYESRRDRAMGVAGPRIERYLRNFVFHSWVHHVKADAPDLMVFSLRLLLHLAAVRFLFFSHPRLLAWFAEQGDEGPDAAALTAFEAICDEVIVEVVRKLGRYIDHSRLLSMLEDMLAQAQMRNLAGAVHLIKF